MGGSWAYPSEFEEVAQALERRIYSSSRLRTILQALRERDLFFVSPDQVGCRSFAPRLRPLWYYKLKGYLAFRRIVPERY